MSVKQMKPYMTNVFLKAENKISDVSCRIASCFNRVIQLNQKMQILSKFLKKNYFL